MTEFIIAGLVLASWIFCYWLGWRDANEQRNALDNIDRLCALASRGIDSPHSSANAVSAVPSKNAKDR